MRSGRRWRATKGRRRMLPRNVPTTCRNTWVSFRPLPRRDGVCHFARCHGVVTTLPQCRAMHRRLAGSELGSDPPRSRRRRPRRVRTRLAATHPGWPQHVRSPSPRCPATTGCSAPPHPVSARIGAEVGARGHEDSILDDRKTHHFIIGMPCKTEQANVARIVTSPHQKMRHLVLQRLVDEELHAL